MSNRVRCQEDDASSNTLPIMSSNTSDEIFQYTGSEIIPNDVTTVHFHCNVVAIEAQTFRDCNFDAKVFYDGVNLREVLLNNGLQSIGDGAFAFCTSLESITIPSTVKDIDEAAFYKCSSLKEVVLNEGLVKIGQSAFSRCESLERISIPSTVIDIDDGQAFYKCSSLKELVLNEGLKKMVVHHWKVLHYPLP